MGVTSTTLGLKIPGDIDGIVPPGYGRMPNTVRVAGDGTFEQFETMHEFVQRTSPNFDNISHPAELSSELVLESPGCQ